MNGNNIFRQKFTRIEGLSTIRRLPRLDKIRLGIKKVSPKTGKEYPFETDYFVCPPEVGNIYGEKPKELNIMFPLNDPEALFPQCYKWYGTSKGLKCKGDGISALRLNDETQEMEERNCPCELLDNGKCKQRASLSFMMPQIKIGGVYQIDLSSYHSIVDINSGLDYAMAMLGGRIAMVPFKLRRVPRETHNEGKKQIHYTLVLELDIPLEYAQRIREGENIFVMQKKKYAIDPPIEYGNPAYDGKEDRAIVTEDTGVGIKEREKKQAELKEKLIEEDKQLKENKDILKKEVEQGKHNIKTPEEIKEALERRNTILADIVEMAKENNISTWGEIVDVGERHGVFVKGLVASQVKTYVVDNPEKCEELKKAIRCDQEIAEEDLPVENENRQGKLEIRDENAPFPDEKEKPGSSFNNPIPFVSKKKKISKAEDFIAPK
jgi:hypothetical protein